MSLDKERANAAEAELVELRKKLARLEAEMTPTSSGGEEQISISGGS